MARSKKSQKKKSSNGPPQPSKRSYRALQPRSLAMARLDTLDQHALAYRRLLMDPCGAQLAKSVFPGADGSIMFRAESDFTIPSSDSGIIIFIPSAGYVLAAPRIPPTPVAAYAYSPGVFLGQASTDTSSLTVSPAYQTIPAGPIDAYTAATAVGLGTNASSVLPAFPPGLSFLTKSASSFRTVAACVQMMYIGKNSDRAGLVFSGISPANSLVDPSTTIDSSQAGFPPTAASTSGVSISPSTVRTMCDNVLPVPPVVYERKYFPSEGDGEFSSVNQAGPRAAIAGTGSYVFSDTNDYSKKSSIVMGYSGLWAGGGGSSAGQMRVRLVHVLEWNPVSTIGLVSSRPHAARSTTTLNSVLRSMEGAADWTLGAMDRAISFGVEFGLMGQKLRGRRSPFQLTY